MRITQHMMSNNLSRSLTANMEKLMKTQGMVSSGKKISIPSDDPSGMSRVLDYRKTLDSIDQYSRNITQANSNLNVADTTLSDIQGLLNQAKSLGISAANGTYNADDRQTFAAQLQQIRDQLIQLANTKVGDRYLFGGNDTVNPPYDASSPDSAVFQGNDDPYQVAIGDGLTLDVHVSGESAFAATADPVVVLNALINGLNNNDTSAASQSLDSLDQCMTQVSNVQSSVGITLNRLDATSSHLSDLKLNIQSALSDTEDADYTQTITDLTMQQSAYEASLAAAAKIVQPTLLDYLG